MENKNTEEKERTEMDKELMERIHMDGADMEEIEFDSSLVQLSYELIARCEEKALALGMKTSTYISMCLWASVEQPNTEGA